MEREDDKENSIEQVDGCISDTSIPLCDVSSGGRTRSHAQPK